MTSLTAKAKLIAAMTTLPGLADVDDLIRTKLVSEADLLAEIPKYLLDLGGKRMRPVLALLCGRVLGAKKAPEDLITVAAGIELIHMATLLHDDIIDRSPLRRHKTSAYIKFGMESTLLSGDFLLVRAFSLCAHLDRFVIDSTEQACIELTEGEICEVPLSKANATVATSLMIAQKKTGALFWLATRAAAHIVALEAKISPELADELTEHMADFGSSLGIGFQVLDDILDVTAPEDLLGKKSGVDLREQKPSMINVLWLQTGSKLAKEVLTGTAVSEDQLAAALIELKQSPVVLEARAIARRYVDEANKSLGQAIEVAERAGLAVNQSALADVRLFLDYTLERME